MKRKQLIPNTVLTLFLLLSVFAYSQKTGRISGNVQDKNQPVEFATVTLAYRADTSKIIQYAVTDSLGNFTFDKLTLGTYQLKISLIGYIPIAKNVEISDKNTALVLNPILLEPDTKVLNEVTITGQKSIIQKTNEGFIVNASANLTQAGGTATDLLKNTPTVAVDADGGVTLRGKTPMILINGRNSNLANLDQLPASSIENIEIITSASAKYDANAESGIINIVLKKNRADGTNGALVLGAGAGAKYRVNSSALLNHKSKKWNLGLAYDNRFAGRTRQITGERTNFTQTDLYQLNQNRSDDRLEQLQNLKFTTDFQANSRNLLSFEAIGNLQGQDNNEYLTSNFFTKTNNFNTGTFRYSNEIRRSKVAEFALNFDHQFDKKEKSLMANLTTSIEKGRENTAIDTRSILENSSYLDDVTFQKTHNYEDGIISNAKLDFATPISNKNSLEMGYKGTFRTVTTDYLTANKIGESYVTNTAASNIFNFGEYVNAAYLLFHGKNKQENWNYDLGLRAEQVNNKGETQDNSTHFTNNYFKLFPTANLMFHPTADGSWKLSYGKRINRPGLGQLNPFIDITDAFNPHSGNPNLKPEIIHTGELGYSLEKNSFTLTSNLFYRHSINTIRSFFQDLGNGVVLNKPMNIGTADSYGWENVLTAKPTTYYDLNASLSLFEQKYNATNIDIEAIQNSFNWYGKLINNFVIGKGGKLQVIGNYTSATTTPQGRTIPIYFADLAFQQKFGKGNARLGLTVVDIFNTLKSGSKLYTTDFNSFRNSKADTRAVMLTFAYSFNSLVKEKMLENKFSKEW